jgi:putative aldouronate transport system substrate-binding protein
MKEDDPMTTRKRLASLLLCALCLFTTVPSGIAETGEPIQLTMWINLSDKHSASMTSLDEMPAFIELQKRLNIDIEFIHPANTQGEEAFNLMLASGKFPDLVYTNWGGKDLNELIADGFIYEITDLVEEYAPNYYSVLESNEDAMRQATLPGGRHYGFHFLQLDAGLRAGGPVIREDWVRKLDLEMPVTVEDWYQVLCAFRDQDPNGNGLPDEIPLIAQSGNGLEALTSWASAFGVIQGFCMKDGKVTYGPIEEGFREYLTTLSEWYAQGLIDPDFASTDGTSFAAKATGDVGGAWIGRVSGTLGNYISARSGDGTDFSLTGLPWAQTADGHSYNIRSNMLQTCSGDATVITTANKHVEESMRLLDYIYSPEGTLLFNFGIEGESYVMQDGHPVYTDRITNNPDGLSISHAIASYAMAASSFSMIQHIDYFNQTLVYEQQKQAVRAWGQSEVSLLVPPIIRTTEEHEKYTQIMTDIDTYVAEWATKTIMGQIPLDDYDKYVDQIYKMGIEEAIAIQNAAYLRYIGQ